jgi:hypothetical protein
LTVAGFCWNFNRAAAGNAVRLAMVAAAIVFLNLARLTAACLLTEKEVPFVLAHDLPDLALHILIIAGAVLSSMRIDTAQATAIAARMRHSSEES